MGRKSQVINLVNQYDAFMTSMAARISAINANLDMSESLKKTKIEAIKAEQAELANRIRPAIQDILDAKRKEIFSSLITSRPADYQLQLSNALKICELTGNALLTSDIIEIAKPFTGDQIAINAIKAALAKSGKLDHSFMDQLPMDKRTHNAYLVGELRDSLSISIAVGSQWDGMGGAAVRFELLKKYILDQLDEELNVIEKKG